MKTTMRFLYEDFTEHNLRIKKGEYEIVCICDVYEGWVSLQDSLYLTQKMISFLYKYIKV